MKFLLLSSGRSGTHMLRDVFMHHPDLYGWWDYKGVLSPFPGRLPDELEILYRAVPSTVIFGAMAHFTESIVDLKDPRWRLHWNRLGTIHDVAILLTRQNHLRQYLSMRLAQRDWKTSDYDLWGSTLPRESQPVPLELDLIDFYKYRSQLVDVQAAARIWFPTSSTIEVTYEQLVSNWEETVRNIFNAIGLSWANPIPSTYKQETRPLEQIIANWEEVAPELQEYT